ncbi:MAG: methionine--tRNA ligase [Verrucomicrobia bacterium]|nr:methionine--tRNA ligase [Verrucomicrobiota bacterium]
MSSNHTFFLTTAIDYTNGAPHIGHAYEKVLADVIARYHRLKGDDVFFLTGVDQHGQKVQQSAEKQGVAPQAFVDEITAKFRALWQKLAVDYDGWAATTDELHKDCVRAILQRLWDDQGDDGQSKWLYKKSEGGHYSVRQEQFLTDKERGADGEFGPEWQPVEYREEENFYFRLLPHKQWLLDLIDARRKTDKPLVIPDFRNDELRNAVEKLEGDLCISRPVARLQWGIPFPESFGAGFVTYVWFDALVNYLSFAPGFAEYFNAKSPRHQEEASEPESNNRKSSPQFQDYWPALHVIGKDILIPAHGVYWPIMLRALGFEDDNIPQFLVHGWWNISGAKMSKSLGNVIDPDVLADTYGVEALRYYLMSDIATGKDADFSEERLIEIYNSDLANKLGNLLNRTLSMAAKYRTSILKCPANDLIYGDPAASYEGPFRSRIGMFVATYKAGFEGDANTPDEMNPWLALTSVVEATVHCNRFIEVKAPWKLAKDDTKQSELDAVLYTLAESLRIIAILLSPVLPKAAHGIFDQLNWKLDAQGKESRFQLADATWGGLPDGHVLGQPTPLFPRLETR